MFICSAWVAILMAAPLVIALKDTARARHDAKPMEYASTVPSSKAIGAVGASCVPQCGSPPNESHDD
jgi:hypothetical protein